MIVYCLAGRALDQGHWHTEAQRVEDLMTDLPSPADREAGSEGSLRDNLPGIAASYTRISARSRCDPGAQRCASQVAQAGELAV
jgi:hypothetical protein